MSVRIERQSTLPVPPAVVWDLAARPPRWEEWLSLHVRWPAPPPDQLTEGSRLRQVLSLVGIPLTVSWTVTEFDAPASYAMRGESPVGVTILLSFSLAEAGAGTTLDAAAEISGTLVAGALKNTAEKYAQTQLEASIAALTALLA